VLIAIAENAGDVLERTLEDAGRAARGSTSIARSPWPAGDQAARRRSAKGVVLASPSAASGFVHSGGARRAGRDLHDRAVHHRRGARARIDGDGRSP
jgi:hypothetical protein